VSARLHMREKVANLELIAERGSGPKVGDGSLRANAEARRDRVASAFKRIRFKIPHFK
jgi:hypothetical protein